MNNKILVIRFSAMGDVALMAAALAKVSIENPSSTFYVLTRKKFSPFFDNYTNIKILEADFKKKHKGFLGLIRLFSSLTIFKFDIILDLHQNIRTWVLKFFFYFKKVKIYTIVKGRKEKKNLVTQKKFQPLKSSVERYLDVFKLARLTNDTSISKEILPVFKIEENVSKKINEWIINNRLENINLIGIAPFAQHIGKVWPLEKYDELIQKLFKSQNKILFFGGGKDEIEKLEKLEKSNKNCINLAGKFSLQEELALITHLKLMICGDSSNMHLAALMNIKVLSIWGSTHHFAGFGPLFQAKENILEIEKETLSCRPCSVYGNKPCVRRDYACLNWIDSEKVYQKILTLLEI